MAYNKTDWENNDSPYLNASNLNKIEGGIYDNSLIIGSLVTGEYYQGTWTPTAGTEYPTAPESGYSYYISSLDDSGYTFTGGDLVGRVANNGDKLVYTGTAWSMVDTVNNQLGYYLVDDIESMLSLTPLQGSLCQVYGYYEANDGGGGTFNYDSALSGTNNGGTIINGWVRQYSGAIDVRCFGASTALADNSSYIQSALDNTESILITESFKVATTIDVPSDRIIHGGGILDFSDKTTDFICLQAEGTYGATSVMTADAVEFDLTVEVDDGTLFQAEQYVMVRSDQSIGLTGQLLGEIARIEGVVGNTITLYGGLQDDYLVTDNASVQLLNFSENIRISNMHFQGTEDNTLYLQAIKMDVTRGVTIENCTMDKCHYFGINFNNVYGFVVEDCAFRDAELNGLSYGVGGSLATANGMVVNCFASNIRHMFTAGGTSGQYGKPRNITVTNCTMVDMRDAGLDVHPGGDKIVFDGNDIKTNEGDGITMQGTNCVISNNIIQNKVRGGILIQMHTTAEQNCLVTGNIINSNAVGIAIDYDDDYPNFGKVIISNNIIDSVTECLNISGETEIMTGLSITGNSCVSQAYQGFRILGLKDSTITNNRIEAKSANNVLYITGADNIAIANNTLIGGTIGVSMPIDANDISVSSNTIQGQDTSHVDFRGTLDKIAVNNNIMSGGVSSFGIYLYMSTGSADNINVFGNIVETTGNSPINIRALAGYTINNVRVKDNNVETTSAVGIYLQGADALSVVNSIIDGNFIKGEPSTTYGIRLINCDIIHGGKNLFETCLADTLMAGVTNATQNTTETWA